MMENVKQDNHQKSFDLHKVQATDELETVKFLKTLSKKEREKLGFSPPNKQRRDSGDSGISDVSSSTSDDEDRTIKDKMMENVKQDNHQKSFDLHKVQATDELETVKFLKTLSKKEREKLLTNNAVIQGIVVSVMLVAALLMMRIEQ